MLRAWGVPTLVLCVLFSWNSLPGQDSSQGPSFDTASVKLNRSGLKSEGLRVTPGRLEATNVTVDRLIWTAFGVRSYQIDGLPGWAKTERYDVIAKMGGDEDRGQTAAENAKALTARLQTLIQERFQLKFRREKRSLAAYDLTVSKGGLKLKPADPNEPHPGTMPTGGGSSLLSKFINGKFVNTYWNYTMSQLAGTLTSLFNREVADRTGVGGRYNYTLVMSADTPSPSSDGLPAADSSESVFTSLQDIGLKLESSKIEKDVIAVDHIERPSEN